MDDSSQETNMEYVLMPWDDKTTIFVNEGTQLTQQYSRWELIEKQLRTAKISNVTEFINVIKSYNVSERNGEQRKPNWNCLVLHQYFSHIDENEKKIFFEESGILSTIRNLAIQLKELVPKLKLLQTGSNSSIELHQLQIASLLSHAFFCTFPKRKGNCPSINFNTLYEGAHGTVANYYIEKIKCLVHYFKRIHKNRKDRLGVFWKNYFDNLMVKFLKLHIPDHKFPRWDKTTAGLCSLKVDAEKKIEDQSGFLQMDFANRFVGGGVLGRGCVQEEIRFLISPELIVARLFTECLADNEALFVVGSERFCKYTGYSNTFTFDGDFIDLTPFDENRHRKSYVIVLDALYFHHSSDQYRESKILRELKKAYVGFKPQKEFKTLPLATGNWGCGAYGGDPQLKALLQLMASSQACRDVLYLTFGNLVLKNQIEQLYFALDEKAVNVGTLYRIVKNYNRERKKNQTVFEFVREAINKIEERKYFLKCTPSSSKEINTPFETECTIEFDKIKEKTQEPSNETCFEIDYPEIDLDFDAIDKEVEKNSNNNSAEKNSFMPSEHPSSQQSLGNANEHSNILDMLWFENELDSKTKAKDQEEQTDGAKEHSMQMENSPSLFSDENLKIPCESSVKSLNVERKNLFLESNNQTRKSTKKIENQAPKGQSKKVIQPKIDYFFKK